MQAVFVSVLILILCHAAPLCAGYNDPMKFTCEYNLGNCDTCAWVVAEGVIGSNTDQVFSSFLKRTRDRTAHTSLTVEMNSPGGDLQAAIRLARFIRKLGWSTHVGYHNVTTTTDGQKVTVWLGASPKDDPELTASKCMSACAYAFLGGVARDVQEGGELGVHQFSDPQNSSSNAQLLQGGLAQFAVEMGVDPKLIYVAAASTSARAPKLTVPTRAQLEDWNVVTNYRRDAGWSIEVQRAGVVAAVYGHGQTKASLSVYCFDDGSFRVAYKWAPRLVARFIGKPREMARELGEYGTFVVGVTDNEKREDFEGLGDGHIVARGPAKNLKVADDGELSLTIPVDQTGLGKLRDAKRIIFELAVPHALYGWAPRGYFTTAKAKENLDVALKNCIQG